MRLSPKQKRYWNEANCRWNVKYGACLLYTSRCV